MSNRSKKILFTSLLVAGAALVLLFEYWHYVTNPWTRDGQVRATVIQIAARISGPIVNLPITDNAFVHKGDVLFEIDNRTFRAAFEQAKANLDQAYDLVKNRKEQVNSAEAALQQARASERDATFGVTSAKAHAEVAGSNLRRNQNLVGQGAISKRDFDASRETAITAEVKLHQAQLLLDKTRSASIQAEAELAKAKAQLGDPGQNNPAIREAAAQWEAARLNMEFTKVRAPADGYVSNLTLRAGSQVVANQPVLALIDASSFWVAGYFRESTIGNIRAGDKAVVTLMTYPDTAVTGEVESVGYGISQADGSAGNELLPAISPTFEWIRLAQRVPVRVRLPHLPENLTLRVGTTASVLIVTK